MRLFSTFCEDHLKSKGLEGGDVDVKSIKIPFQKICGPLLVKWDWIEVQEMHIKTEKFKDLRKK